MSHLNYQHITSNIELVQHLTVLVALDLPTCGVAPPHRAGAEVVFLHKRVVRGVTFLFTL